MRKVFLIALLLFGSATAKPNVIGFVFNGAVGGLGYYYMTKTTGNPKGYIGFTATLFSIRAILKLAGE